MGAKASAETPAVETPQEPGAAGLLPAWFPQDVGGLNALISAAVADALRAQAGSAAGSSPSSAALPAVVPAAPPEVPPAAQRWLAEQHAELQRERSKLEVETRGRLEIGARAAFRAELLTHLHAGRAVAPELCADALEKRFAFDPQTGQSYVAGPDGKPAQGIDPSTGQYGPVTPRQIVAELLRDPRHVLAGAQPGAGGASAGLRHAGGGQQPQPTEPKPGEIPEDQLAMAIEIERKSGRIAALARHFAGDETKAIAHLTAGLRQQYSSRKQPPNSLGRILGVA